MHFSLPETSSRQCMIETNSCYRLVDSVVHIETKPESQCNLLICGDFNSRKEWFYRSHMSVLPNEYIPDYNFSLYSQDKGHIDNNGMFLLDSCKLPGVRILMGGPQKIT